MTRRNEQTTLLTLALLTVVIIVNELAAGGVRLVLLGALGIGLLVVVLQGASQPGAASIRLQINGLNILKCV